MNKEQAEAAMKQMESLPVLPYEFVPHGLVKTSAGDGFAILAVTPWTQETMVLTIENLQTLKAACTEGIGELKRVTKKLEVVEKPGLALPG